jgi:hypothetical protein
LLKKTSRSPQPEEQPPNDIQNNMSYISKDINENVFCNSYNSEVVPTSFNNVMPLQIATNDKCQNSNSLFGGAQSYNGKSIRSSFYTSAGDIII